MTIDPQRFQDFPVRYKKGIEPTRSLIPTGTMIGSGWSGKVVEYRNNPEQFVVKKSIWPMDNEYKIGQMLNHENIVKTRALFIKEIPISMYRIYQLVTDQVWGRSLRCKKSLIWALIIDKIHGRPLFLYKMVMDRIYGKTFNKLFGANLDPSIVYSLLQQAQNSLLYLYDSRVFACPIHGENMMLVNDSSMLILVDLYQWALDENLPKRGTCLLREAQRLLFNIVSTSSLYHIGQLEDLTQSNCSIPNLCSADARPSQATEAIVASQWTEECFAGKNELEVRQILESYCQQVIREFQKAYQPELGSSG